MVLFLLTGILSIAAKLLMSFWESTKGALLLLTGQSLLVILCHLSNCGWKCLSSLLKRTLKLALLAVWREKSPQCGQRFALPNLSSNSSTKFPSNFSRSSTIVVHNASISFFHCCIANFH